MCIFVGMIIKIIFMYPSDKFRCVAEFIISPENRSVSVYVLNIFFLPEFSVKDFPLFYGELRSFGHSKQRIFTQCERFHLGT